jgi:hypothetical protein
MKRNPSFKIRKTVMATALLFTSGLCGFASVALSQENANTQPSAPADEISNGAPISLENGISITPVTGWKIERKSMGMGLVMKEILPQVDPKEIDYSKPVFARNITVTSMPEPRFMDERGLEEAKEDIAKIFARDPSLKDFQITDAKTFDYKGKNDGFVIFSQLTVNNFPMMQMQIIVSGEKKSYLLTYSDLAANFANPASYDVAWKSMTSINVAGQPPRRFEKEAIMGGSIALALFAIIVPFMVARAISARKIRNLTKELDHDWNSGAMKTDADYELSDIRSMPATHASSKKSKSKKNDDYESSVSYAPISNGVSNISGFA